MVNASSLVSYSCEVGMIMHLKYISIEMSVMIHSGKQAQVF